jgi:hypothetical protein
LVEEFPSPDQARKEMRDGDNPVASASMIAVARALAAAAYLEQHGSERKPSRPDHESEGADN